MKKISKHLSIIRTAEYQFLTTLSLEGKILDVGGSKGTFYQSLIGGNHEFVSININPNLDLDYVVDIEKPFPFEDERFDHAISLNVFEHVWRYEEAFAETVRVVKRGGRIIVSTPFTHHIHGSPDDYLRYTPSVYHKLAEKYNCQVLEIHLLGDGLFSLIYQSVFDGIPTKTLRYLIKHFCILLDRGLNCLSKRYKKLSQRIPLGLMVVLVRK